MSDLQDLPPHSATCFGCGPESAPGLHLQARLDGEEVVTAYAFTSGYSGSPGIVHGGIVAVLADDLMGSVLWVVRKPAVTRHLEVDYLHPVLVGVTYDVRAGVVRVEGRKVFARCVGTDPAGVVTFTGSALFIEVGREHFDRGIVAAV